MGHIDQCSSISKSFSDMFLLSSLLSGRSVERVVGRNEGLACRRPRPEPEN